MNIDEIALTRMISPLKSFSTVTVDDYDDALLYVGYFNTCEEYYDACRKVTVRMYRKPNGESMEVLINYFGEFLRAYLTLED